MILSSIDLDLGRSQEHILMDNFTFAFPPSDSLDSRYFRQNVRPVWAAFFTQPSFFGHFDDHFNITISGNSISWAYASDTPHFQPITALKVSRDTGNTGSLSLAVPARYFVTNGSVRYWHLLHWLKDARQFLSYCWFILYYIRPLIEKNSNITMLLTLTVQASFFFFSLICRPYFCFIYSASAVIQLLFFHLAL